MLLQCSDCVVPTERDDTIHILKVPLTFTSEQKKKKIKTKNRKEEAKKEWISKQISDLQPRRLHALPLSALQSKSNGQ